VTKPNVADHPGETGNMLVDDIAGLLAVSGHEHVISCVFEHPLNAQQDQGFVLGNQQHTLVQDLALPQRPQICLSIAELSSQDRLRAEAKIMNKFVT
jgi:hypothetical protein